MIIKEVSAHQILDSRKQPTIEVVVNGCKASAPSGKSTGKYETKPYNKSLKNSINQINSLTNLPNINSFSDLSKLEQHIKKQFKLKDAKQFGANSLFALESAILKALAKENKKRLWQIINQNAKKLPTPIGNAIGGGLHSSKFKTHPLFQEFLLIPKGISFKQKYKIMKSTYKKLKSILKSNKTNDEGALQTELNDEAVLSILQKFNDKINIGIDIASSSFYKNNKYSYNLSKLSQKEQIKHINELIKKYNLYYAEDPLQENDFQGFSKIIKSNCLIAGDDLTATHLNRLKKAIVNNSINAMIIKPNQNGSLIELAEIIKYCKKYNIKTILSHRSGETFDTSIADLAFAFQADFIKIGIATPYREAKLKRLVEIEKSISSR
jgi:enolase